MSEVDSRADGERHAASRRDVFDLSIAVSGGPDSIGNIFQSPDGRIRRMLGYSGNGTREIISLLFINMMREELRVVIEHYETAPQPDAWGKIELMPAGPTAA